MDGWLAQQRLGLHDQYWPGLAGLGSVGGSRFASQTSPRLGIRVMLNRGKFGIHPHAFFTDLFRRLGSSFGAKPHRVSRFIRSMARRIYAALDRFKVSAHRLLVFKRSSGNFNETAPIVFSIRYSNEICIKGISISHHMQGLSFCHRRRTQLNC